MNHKKILFTAILLAGSLSVSRAQSRCMASPYPVTVSQPDGTTLTIVGHGHIDVNYAETVDGYTVVRNQAGIYEYAKPAIDGGFIPSGVKASEPASRNNLEKIYLLGEKEHLRYAPEKVQQLLENATAAATGLKPGDGHDHTEEIKSVTGSFPGQGKRKILLILIQYPDLKAKYQAGDFYNLMNQENYKNIGSFRDFYSKSSFGKLELDIDVFGWYTAVNGYQYYANSEGKGRARLLVANAVDSAEKSGVDFSIYDNDKDGEVDGVMVIHSGPGAEEGSQNDYIWSHRWSLGGSTSRIYDGVEIDNYAINPESRNGQSRMVGIGVLCHEFGHLLGLPDLYDVTYQSAGLGNWSLMAGGCWLDNENTPANNDAWSKAALGWITPVNIDAAGYYYLKPAVHDSVVYKVTTPVSHEYFLLENRQWTGFDKKLPWKGLAIWHVNELVLSNTLGDNSVNADKDMKGIDMEEADGNNGLDNVSNRGDAGDLFPGIKNKTLFDDDGSPNARTYDGEESGIRVFGISILPDSSVKFGFGALPQAVFIPSAMSICQNQAVEFSNKSKFATSYSWNFGDGSTSDTSSSPIHTFTQPGDYYVKLIASDNGNTAIDSVKITVNPEAIADFDWTITGMDVSITNKSQNAKAYIWYWGDGKVGYSNAASILRTYTDTGSYDLKLVVAGEGNCNDTMVQTIYVSGRTEEKSVNLDLRAVPNPAREIVYLEFNSQSPTSGSVSVINTIGQSVSKEEEIPVAEGINKIPVNLSDARPGLYIVKLLLDGKTYYVSVARK